MVIVSVLKAEHVIFSANGPPVNAESMYWVAF